MGIRSHPGQQVAVVAPSAGSCLAMLYPVGHTPGENVTSSRSSRPQSSTREGKQSGSGTRVTTEDCTKSLPAGDNVYVGAKQETGGENWGITLATVSQRGAVVYEDSVEL